jgi:peroxiredoxin
VYIIKADNNWTTHIWINVIILALTAMCIVSCSNEEKAVKIGDNAPEFTVRDLDGNEISLADYSGSPVILRFFLTDCKFCRADTPIFNRYFSRYESQGLKIFYLDSLDIDRKILAAFRQELAIPFPVVLDTGGNVAKSYHVRAMPQTILLSSEHKIIAAILGGVSEEELNRALAPYIRLAE